MCVELYKHNKSTYENIKSIWQNDNRAAIVQPTGSGKSYVILKCCEDYNEQNKLIFAPTNEILTQFDNHCVEYKIKNYKLITYTALSFMKDEEIEKLNPSFVVFDEFHRCGATQWGSGVQKLLNCYPNVKVLGASATPIRYLEDSRDMSDELFDGHLAVNMTLAEAIVDHILPMPKYISALYTLDEEIKKLNDKINKSSNSDESKKELKAQVKLMKQNLNKSHGIPAILKKYLTETKNGKFIIFCKNIEHLNEMKETVIKWFNQAKVGKSINTYSIYSNYENGKTEFESFKNDNSESVRLLFSIEMLNEGVHLSDINGAILLRTTVSPIIYYQQIGRVIDADKNKGFQPIIFDFVNNFDNIKTGNLKVDIEKVVEEKNSEGKSEGKERQEVDLSEFRVFDEVQDIRALFDQIQDKLFDNWDVMYQELVEYYNKYGDCLVPIAYGKLGAWVCTQRNQFKKNQITKNRKNQLDSIHFIWDVLDNAWQTGFKQLKKYQKRFGNTDINYQYIDDDNYNLGFWVQHQRSSYRQMKLQNDKIQLLNSIHFIWDALPNQFCQQLIILDDFLKKHNCNINSIKDHDIYNNHKIGKWIAMWRKGIKNNTLPKYKVDALIKYNLIIDVYNYKWNDKFNQLLEYKNINKNCNINTRNSKLGKWADAQRQNYKKGKLSQDQINKLLSMGFEFNPRKSKKESA